MAKHSQHTSQHHCPHCLIVPTYLLKNMVAHATKSGGGGPAAVAFNAIAPGQSQRRLKGLLDSISGSAKTRTLRRANLVLDVSVKGAAKERALESLMGEAPARRRSAAAATPRLQRAIHDGRKLHLLPGKLVRSERGKASADDDVNWAFDYSGVVHEFFRAVFGRHSLDSKGLPLVSTVHHRDGYTNAFWNGTQMAYGDGDGEVFGSFTKSLDVIAHELAHGVTEYMSGLEYQDQPGALNESFSDVMGSLVKQWRLNHTASQADWLIGNDLFLPGVDAKGIRSLAAPGTAYDNEAMGQDPQPSHMRNYYDGDDDSGGVHINSGIPNHAFYTTCMTLGGNAWGEPGQIWYKGFSTLKRLSTFKDARAATLAAARALFGRTSKQAKAVSEGWKRVGVK